MPLHAVSRRLGGLLLIAVGLSFAGGWELLRLAPGAVPTTMRSAPALLHLVSSLGLISAVVMLQTERRTCLSKTTRVGAWGMLVGALGLCLLTGLHLSLSRQAPLLYLPVLLAVLLGGGVYSAGTYHIDATSPWAKRLFLVGLAWGLVGGLLAQHAGSGWPLVQQGLWRWTALGYLWLGFEVAFKWRPDVGRYRAAAGWPK